jgi:hypothetical protein
LTPTGNATHDIDIVIGDGDQAAFPEHLVDAPLDQHLNNYVRTHIGTVSTLDNFLSSGSSDGVIPPSSQLRDAAQEDARTIRGFDEGHLSILQSEDVISNVNSIFVQAE